MNASASIPPGSTLGVFGGGQLGRMFAVAASRLGYRTIVYAPEADCPTSHVAAEHVRAAYDDDEQVVDFARRCDVVTLEFENVPVRCLELASRHTLVRPGPNVLAIAQDRVAERRFLDANQLPSTAHQPVASAAECGDAVDRLGAPGVLKSARGGYDGKGQVRIDVGTDVTRAWNDLSTGGGIYERWVEYRCELSVLVARSPRGETRTFGPIRNRHHNHILDVSTAPADVDRSVSEHAIALASQVAEALGLEGLICVEMFLTRDDRLLINELAPRPHNSGHLTIEACDNSQFEQQVRAICGLPLGEMRLRSPAAMVNILGDCWHAARGTDGPGWAAALAVPGAHLHLYGKPDPLPGRKMGHLTVLASSPEQAASTAREIRQRVAAAWESETPDEPVVTTPT